MFIIRPSLLSEFETITDIWLQTSRQAHDFIPFRYWQEKKADMRHIYLPASENWVCQNDKGKILGFLSLHNDSLAALFVKPEAQHTGIGRLLLQEAKTQRSRLSLRVYKKNTSALIFYLKHGFSIRKEQIDADTGEWEYEMSWQINPDKHHLHCTS